MSFSQPPFSLYAADEGTNPDTANLGSRKIYHQLGLVDRHQIPHQLNIEHNRLAFTQTTQLRSSGHANVFVSGAGGLRFKSRAGQIGHSVANGSPPLRHFFERSCVAHRRIDAEMGPANSLHTSS